MSQEEQVPSVDQIDDEEPEQTPGYKPPAQKTLDEISKLDADDESLVRYKQALLGDANISKGEGPNVVVEKLSIVVDGREDVEIDLTGDLSKLKDRSITIKEGTAYRLKITFKINHEIVAGLKFFQLLYRKGIRVDKTSLMVGSYGPKPESQTFLAPPDEAPSGMLARGHYTAKSKFTDDDKNSVLEWEWSFDIKKDWD
ncbi:rho GDP-dissociation inhibitor 1 [Exaiptasia diaphana]|uniref:Rho GDP-dissociation inhibitor 3 n=1 Tax=Exaiptasia diaphana TaxID=2652724 RepID=A0A913X887_EXADI|nr:rho GDP-dissociation inhibitor 1 [Exaiptasia diaphana]KXJ26832.1 Rho GDP-dissociation inhibitor 1 [Exaiptasia diaphana]